MNEFFKVVIDLILRIIIMMLPVLALVCVENDLIWLMYLIFIIEGFIMDYWKNNF